MAAQVEVKLGRVCDCAVHCGAGWDVSAFSHLRWRGDGERSLTALCYKGDEAAKGEAAATGTYPLGFVGAEQPRVVAFLDHDVGDPRPVVLLQADAGLPDGDQLRPRHLKHNDTHLMLMLVKNLILWL